MAGASLTGTRLYLRPFATADLSDAYLAWLNDPEVTRYLEVGREPETLVSVREYVRRFEQSSTDLLFAIVDRESDRHIGNVTLNSIRPHHGTADTGLLIGERSFWGKGYATEAWYLVASHAFNALALHKLIAGSCVANRASIAALKHVGFQVEGVLREEFCVDGKHMDVLRLGLLQGELKAPPWD